MVSSRNEISWPDESGANLWRGWNNPRSRPIKKAFGADPLVYMFCTGELDIGGFVTELEDIFS